MQKKGVIGIVAVCSPKNSEVERKYAIELAEGLRTILNQDNTITVLPSSISDIMVAAGYSIPGILIRELNKAKLLQTECNIRIVVDPSYTRIFSGQITEYIDNPGEDLKLAFVAPNLNDNPNMKVGNFVEPNFNKIGNVVVPNFNKVINFAAPNLNMKVFDFAPNLNIYNVSNFLFSIQSSIKQILNETPPTSTYHHPEPIPAVRVDGLYQAEKYTNWCTCLRFYSDLTVISDIGPRIPKYASEWFHKYDYQILKGTYKIKGSHIKFRCTSYYKGTVDYDGEIKGEILILESHTLNNDSKDVKEYKFIKF
jgi:hypothetical protein